jgi:hypothetical protein
MGSTRAARHAGIAAATAAVIASTAAAAASASGSSGFTPNRNVRIACSAAHAFAIPGTKPHATMRPACRRTRRETPLREVIGLGNIEPVEVLVFGLNLRRIWGEEEAVQR